MSDLHGDGGGAEMLKLQVSGKAILSRIRCRREASFYTIVPLTLLYKLKGLIFQCFLLMQMSTSSSYAFGPYKIDPREVFYATPFSYAMVNLRPLLPGMSSSTPIIHTISISLLLLIFFHFFRRSYPFLSISLFGFVFVF